MSSFKMISHGCPYKGTFQKNWQDHWDWWLLGLPLGGLRCLGVCVCVCIAWVCVTLISVSNFAQGNRNSEAGGPMSSPCSFIDWSCTDVSDFMARELPGLLVPLCPLPFQLPETQGYSQSQHFSPCPPSLSKVPAISHSPSLSHPVAEVALPWTWLFPENKGKV